LSTSPSYWNHNTAYHPWILRILGRRSRVLDVGCGDGLLLERLAPSADTVVGLEPDPGTAVRARTRVAGLPSVEVVEADFLTYRPSAPFDAVVFVASLHHVGLTPGLERAKDLLSPGGVLVVVGLARDDSLADLVRGALSVPVNRVLGRLRQEQSDIGVPVDEPTETYADLRRVVRSLLPGAHWRYGLHYRYLLRWTAPPNHRPRLPDSPVGA
jgi:SAM-dependent methyltransferase